MNEYIAVYERADGPAGGQKFSKVIKANNLEDATTEATNIAEAKGYIFLSISEDVF